MSENENRKDEVTETEPTEPTLDELKAKLEKLEAENVLEDAKTAAEHSIWEIFQPMISNLSSKYALKVEFK